MNTDVKNIFLSHNFPHWSRSQWTRKNASFTKHRLSF